MGKALRIIVIALVLGSVISVGIIYVLFQSGPMSNQLPSITIEDQVVVGTTDLIVTVSATGAITPVEQLALTFDFSAPVREILVKEGQLVKAGDVLARLDSPDLENALANAQLGLTAQQVSYDALTRPAREVDIAVAEAAVAAAQAQAASASLGADPEQIEIARLQAELSRNQLWQAQLQRDLPAAAAQQAADQAGALGFTVNIPQTNPADNVTNAITQAQNGVALADVNVSGVANTPADVGTLAGANAQLVAAQNQLDLLMNGATDLQLQIAQTQLQIALLGIKQAENALNRAILIAPIDGIVAKNNLVVGEAPPQGAAMSIIDSSAYYVDVAVDETDIVSVAVGQDVTLRLDALPDTRISAKVTRVALTPIRIGQLVTYTVRVTLDPTEAPIRAGMTTTATITVNQLNDVIALPNRFIRIDSVSQQAYVTVQEATNEFTEIPVTLGVRNDSQSEIVSGLTVDQTVVLIPRASFNPIDN